MSQNATTMTNLKNQTKWSIGAIAQSQHVTMSPYKHWLTGYATHAHSSRIITESVNHFNYDNSHKLNKKVENQVRHTFSSWHTEVTAKMHVLFKKKTNSSLGNEITAKFYDRIFQHLRQVKNDCKTVKVSWVNCTSWKLIWSYKFFEKFISTCYFVQVHRIISKPELQHATFLKTTLR